MTKLVFPRLNFANETASDRPTSFPKVTKFPAHVDYFARISFDAFVIHSIFLHKPRYSFQQGVVFQIGFRCNDAVDIRPSEHATPFQIAWGRRGSTDIPDQSHIWTNTLSSNVRFVSSELFLAKLGVNFILNVSNKIIGFEAHIWAASA